MLFAALILPSSDELSISTFPGDFLKSVQTQQSDWKIKRSFAQVRMFMSRDKIFNYFASFQHISKTGWIQLIKHQQLNIVLLTDQLRQRGTPSAGFCLHFNHSRHDTAVAPALHCRQPSGRTNSKIGLQMLSTPFLGMPNQYGQLLPSQIFHILRTSLWLAGFLTLRPGGTISGWVCLGVCEAQNKKNSSQTSPGSAGAQHTHNTKLLECENDLFKFISRGLLGLG